MAAPVKTVVQDAYEGEVITCAKIVATESSPFKLTNVCPVNDDYIFQIVVKAAAARTLTIKVGDQTKTQAVTTSFARYIIAFPGVNVSSSPDVYITFPAGTYYLYNIQLERATTASSWRPAPEDPEEYADKAVASGLSAYDLALDQQKVFNKLTNNGALQGIYMSNGNLYINGSYIAAGTISADFLSGGTISGSEINIGSGVFQVNSAGQVSASNINITGGSVDIATAADTDDKIILSNGNKSIKVSPDRIEINNATATNPTQTRVDPKYIDINYNGTYVVRVNSTTQGAAFIMRNTSNNSVITINVASSGSIFTVSDGAGNTRFTINTNGTDPLVTVYNNDGNYIRATGADLTYYNSSNKRRVQLDASSLRFYNASGTLTKTYANS